MLTTDRLTICLLTFNRPEYAEKTLRSTLMNIRFDGIINVHVADDGTPDSLEYRQWLLDIASPMVNGKLSSTDSERGGYGKNYNLAMQAIHNDSDYILPLEDDWKLTRELDLNELVDVLDVGEFGCVRLGYIGYTQSLRGEFKWINNKHWLVLDPDSPEPHVFAGHPRLETVVWERTVGPWPEGLKPGETEFSVAHRKAARQGVAWPIDLVKPSGDLFAHIGTIRSY